MLCCLYTCEKRSETDTTQPFHPNAPKSRIWWDLDTDNTKQWRHIFQLLFSHFLCAYRIKKEDRKNIYISRKKHSYWTPKGNENKTKVVLLYIAIDVHSYINQNEHKNREKIDKTVYMISLNAV